VGYLLSLIGHPSASVWSCHGEPLNRGAFYSDSELEEMLCAFLADSTWPGIDYNLPKSAVFELKMVDLTGSKLGHWGCNHVARSLPTAEASLTTGWSGEVGDVPLCELAYNIRVDSVSSVASFCLEDYSSGIFGFLWFYFNRYHIVQ
jgi:hypothetical protein